MGIFGFLPHALYTMHRDANTTGLSPRLWSRVTGSIQEPDGAKRLVLIGDDFTGIQNAGTMTDLYSECAYVLKADDTTNHTAVGAADENGGVLQLTIDAGAGANEEIGIALGDGTQQACQISDTAGSDFLTAFECRVKVSSVTDGQLALSVGLLGPGQNDGDIVADTTGIPNTSDHGIGFNIKADDGDAIDFWYEAASQTRVDKIEGVAVPTADTFVKLGFLYDPAAPASKRIKVFVDNVEQSTYVTATDIATATFPDAEPLVPTFGMKGIAGSVALEFAIDWWALGQVIT